MPKYSTLRVRKSVETIDETTGLRTWLMVDQAADPLEGETPLQVFNATLNEINAMHQAGKATPVIQKENIGTDESVISDINACVTVEELKEFETYVFSVNGSPKQRTAYRIKLGLLSS